MSDIAHQTSLIDDDDLFTRPPRSARRMPVVQQARRQCRACNGSYVVPLDYDRPPLCPDCLLDIDATKKRIQTWLHGISDQEDAAAATWLAFAEQHADDWDRIQAARKRLSGEAFDRKAADHVVKGDIYGKLLQAEDAYEQALAALGAERARLERALEVIQ